ncbi:hypothetical protein ROS9278_04578 [Roseomonas sp. CECT 9278]|nr:hypothetical protein ROS9278_04578 [Roseomonas sp. CECT 9278]
MRLGRRLALAAMLLALPAGLAAQDPPTAARPAEPAPEAMPPEPPPAWPLSTSPSPRD